MNVILLFGFDNMTNVKANYKVNVIAMLFKYSFIRRGVLDKFENKF